MLDAGCSMIFGHAEAVPSHIHSEVLKGDVGGTAGRVDLAVDV